MVDRSVVRKGPVPRRPEDRFWEKVLVESWDECWEWAGTMKPNGYGQFMVQRRPSIVTYAHRYAWALYCGPIPEGLFVCHRCDNRSCVNPKHLFVGTCADNLRDMREKGREARGDTHGRRKLSEISVRALRSEYKHGAQALELAEKYGISRGQVYAIANGRTWAHVPGAVKKYRR